LTSKCCVREGRAGRVLGQGCEERGGGISGPKKGGVLEDSTVAGGVQREGVVGRGTGRSGKGGVFEEA